MSSKTIDQTDVAFVADALLALCQPEAPWDVRRPPSERSFDMNDDTFVGAMMAKIRPNDDLLALECRTVWRCARLTDRQRHVVRLRLSGVSFEEIGRRRGHSRQGAQSIFLQAIKKLTRAWHVYPYAGLADVYRGETTRGLR